MLTEKHTCYHNYVAERHSEKKRSEFELRFTEGQTPQQLGGVMIFDTHAHYDDEAFDGDREELLDSMKDGGVEYIVNVGADISSSKATLDMVGRYPNIYGALGVHPDNVGDIKEEDFKWLKQAIYSPKIVAVGEIGLDYHWSDAKELQKEWFVRQMELAREARLPIIVHSRDAAADTLDVIKASKAGEIGGIIHCFSYEKEMAREYLDMGFYLGIGGVVTFKNARKLKEVVEYAPITQLVLETDCPYLAPEPNRGKRNSSLNLTYVVNEIARIKGMDPNEVIIETNKNAKRVYNI